MPNRADMHNRALHDTLASFVEEAAWQLASEVSDGAEVPFELIEQGRASAPLYCYRPLTSGFIAARLGSLSRLPSYPAAAQGLERLPGLDAYLRARGNARPPADRRAKADATLQAFLTTMWAEATDFVFDGERFAAAYAELEGGGYDGCSLTEVMAPVEGLVCESDAVPMGDGLALVRGSLARDAPDDLRGDAFATVATLRLETMPGEPAGLEVAGRRLRRVQTALRLWHDTEPALGPGAWARSDGGAWLHVPLATGVRRPGEDCLLAAEDEDALRAFASLVARRTPHGGELAWALRRFELGCERGTALEALTDWLLAGRALLAEPDAPGYQRLVERLAAICATPEERPAMTARLLEAISLERSAVAGFVRAEPAVETLVSEVGSRLRAVLRDVLCGHLDPDLRRVADARIAAEAAVAR